jgi:hypothetical protein
LSQIKHFDFQINESGEEWPVKFWGNTQNLSSLLTKWNVEFPDLWECLKEYFIELIEGKTEWQKSL